MHKRNTRSKQLILDSLKKAGGAITQESLQEELGNEVDRATIYRALNSFCDDGVAHKILGDDGKYYFAFCMNCIDKKHKHQHFHFRCIDCGKTECLPNEINIKLPAGYEAVNFNAIVSGYCSVCT